MRESSRHLANREVDETETKETEEQESATKFAGGKPPPVSDKFGDQAGSAQLAFSEEDSNEKELKEKVGALVSKRFGGDFKKAFTHYDVDKDGGVNKDEITKLLSDAGVGNGLTRGAWAKGILKKLDRDENGAIEWTEFQSVFSGATATA